MSGIGSIGSGNLLNSFGLHQQNLLQNVNQLSSGKRITDASVDPSGLAIYESLTTQAQGFDQGAANAQDALNASNVAEGALQTTTDILQRQNSLAVEATNDFLSPTQRAALNTEANQLNQQINTIASNTTFNGLNLLNGSASAPTSGTAASATVPTNAALNGGGTLVSGTPTVAAGTPSETLQISVVNNGGVAQAQVNVVDTATGSVTNAGTFGSGATAVIAGTTVTFGNFSTADVGTNATVQVQGATAGSSGNPATVQTGAAQGAVTQVGFVQADVATLGTSNLNFATSDNSTNAQGAIGNALQSLLSSRAELGAQSVSLQEDINNSNIASVNLTSSASSIGDLNVGAATTQNSQDTTESQITLALLANANHQAGVLSALLNSTH